MQIVILVDDVSKIMKIVYKKPFLTYLLNSLMKQGVKTILFASSTNLSQIKLNFSYGYKNLKIVYLNQEITESQKSLIHKISKGPFFVIDGNSIFDINYKKIKNKKDPMIIFQNDFTFPLLKESVYFLPKNKKGYNLNNISSLKIFLEENNLHKDSFKFFAQSNEIIYVEDEQSLKLLKNNIFHLRFNNYSMKETIEAIELKVKNTKKSLVVPVNLDMLRISYKDSEFRNIINGADITLIDGKPLLWFSKLYRKKFKYKVSGSDLIYPLLEMMNHENFSLFIVGGKEGVAEAACRKIEKEYKGIKIAGYYSPPFGFEKNAEQTEQTISIINQANPQVVLLCLSAPKQEKFYTRNCDKLISATYICAGATVDFLAGNVRRAPKWMSALGLEWFYRLCKEPKRLFKKILARFLVYSQNYVLKDI